MIYACTKEAIIAKKFEKKKVFQLVELAIPFQWMRQTYTYYQVPILIYMSISHKDEGVPFETLAGMDVSMKIFGCR